MVAAYRNTAETNPTTGVTVTHWEAASIWMAPSERIAQARTSDCVTSTINHLWLHRSRQIRK
jgi:hypothetical protein